MIFSKSDKKNPEEQFEEEPDNKDNQADSKPKPEKRKKLFAKMRTIAWYCSEGDVKPWIKAGMMALKQWDEDTQVTRQEFKNGLEEFNSRPQGG